MAEILQNLRIVTIAEGNRIFTLLPQDRADWSFACRREDQDSQTILGILSYACLGSSLLRWTTGFDSL